MHGKDEVLRYHNPFMEAVPIPIPSDGQRETIENYVCKLIESTKHIRGTESDIIAWLRSEHNVVDPSSKLRASTDLDAESFVSEVRKVRGQKNPLSLAAFRSLREEDCAIHPSGPSSRGKKQAFLERRISDIVNSAYGLGVREIELMGTVRATHADCAVAMRERLSSSVRFVLSQ